MKLRISIRFFLILFIISCTNPEKGKYEKENKKYYQTEVINENFIDLYGKWRLKEIETG